MRLVACPGCHTQYDVTDLADSAVSCPCGTRVEIGPVRAVDAAVRRCGSCGALLPEDGDHCDYCRARVQRDGELSLICPECYGRNARDSRFCTACGVEFRPQPLPGEAAAVGCPVCAEEMEPGPIGGQTVLECRKCNGLWIPGTSFDDLVNRAIEAWKGREEEEAVLDPRRSGGNPAAARVEYRRCPACAQVMHRRNYLRTSGVVIDQCRDHGTWLDADELERIAGFILTGGVDRARAAEKTTMRAPESLATRRQAVVNSEFQRVLSEHHPSYQSNTILVKSIGSFLSRLLGN